MRTHECDNNLLLLNFTQYMIIKPIHSWLHKLQTKHVVLKRTTHSRSTDIHVHTKTHLCFWAIPLFSSCAIESYSLKSIIVLLKSIIVFFLGLRVVFILLLINHIIQNPCPTKNVNVQSICPLCVHIFSWPIPSVSVLMHASSSLLPCISREKCVHESKEFE